MPAHLDPAVEFAGNQRFEIVRRIGAGGIGLVYEAIDREYGTRVAIKTLQRLDGDALLRFKNEFRMLQGLHHPNLVRLGELFEEGGSWFFTMELIDGVDFMSYVSCRTAVATERGAVTERETVHDSRRETVRYPALRELSSPSPRSSPSLDSSPSLLRDPGADTVAETTPAGAVATPEDPDTVALSPKARQRRNSDRQPVPRKPRGSHRVDVGRLRNALGQLAEGLSALHRAGMVHRDIKPHNVMVADGRVVLLDFGLVSEERPWHHHDSEEGLVLGTPTYMAPEQAAGHVATPASDWYAVGAMLYYALTGVRPFEGQVAQILLAKQTHDPKPPSRLVQGPIPSDLEELCMGLLARDPEARPSEPEILARLGATVERVSPAVSGPIAMLGLDTEVELVGRERELDALGDAFGACGPGTPAAVFVSGTSGMGKSSLVARFARQARDQSGALVLRGRCYEREVVPYKAFDGVIDELSRYLHRLRLATDDDPDSFERSDDDDSDLRVLLDTGSDTGGRPSDLGLGVELDPAAEAVVSSLFGPAFAVLARLFPVLDGVFDDPAEFLSDRNGLGTSTERRRRNGDGDDELGDSGGLGAASIRDPGELRRRAFAALKALLVRIASLRPLVIVIDDLQWGDLDSTALLTELISPPDAPGFLLLASYRSEEASGELIRSLRTGVKRALGERMRDLPVGPLSRRDAHKLSLAIWRRLDTERARAHQPAAFDGNLDGWGQHLARICMQECAGSPFFLGEMMRYLASFSRGAEGVEAGYITLANVLLERRRQLDGPARALLDVVAVAGRPIPQGVALRAAGLDGEELSALAGLRAGHFVRTRGPSLSDAVEIYHDRIREAVLVQLGEDELRGHHGWLADALEDWGIDDPEMLAVHYHGAGRLERAAELALAAAEAAERALAFGRAAHMLRLVLDVRAWSEPEQRDLYIRLGNALSNAGRSTEAIDAYLAAAEGAASTDEPSSLTGPEAPTLVPAIDGYDVALECRRRAADQMFRSGHFDQGSSLLELLMARVGLSWAKSSKRALLSLLLRRAWLRVRGLGYRPRAPESIPVSERQRSDLLWSGALAVSAVDLVRGAELATRCLLTSLRQGDEARIAATMAVGAGHIASRGRRHARRAARVARRASAIARRTGDPLARGLAALAPGIIAMLTGRWRLATIKLARAEEIFREQCMGASWEAATAQMFRCLAHFYLGEWELLGRQAATSTRHALERGDHYTAAVLDCLAPYGDLVIDDPAGARHTIGQAEVHWQVHSGYHLQHYLQLLTKVQIDLYTGDAHTAWARIVVAWKPLGRSLLRRVQMTRVESTHMRARAALALALAEPDLARRFVGVAAGDARALLRERVPWATALARLLMAGVNARRDRRRRVLSLLEDAEEQLEELDMVLFAASARRQRGRFISGAVGDELVAQADRAMRDRGVYNPAAAADMLVPGVVPSTSVPPARAPTGDGAVRVLSDADGASAGGDDSRGGAGAI
ncbi:serine/threonine-protein kinase PknK [Haliangium sp.]|uniref:serine/threonine-protein kinase n=1 Tax=Haliangium sp. TaxID=2663208 RepID=UPI003D0B4EBF